MHPMAGDLIASIDVGTTGCKVVLFDRRGRRAGYGYARCEPTYRAGGVVEQDPNAWWRAVVRAAKTALADVDRGRVGAVALTSQRASVIPVDGQGRALGPALMWQDKRAADICAELRATLSEPRVYRRTGLRVDPYFSLARILWLQRHAKRVFDRAHKLLGVFDLVLHRLTGEFVTDESQASRTLLFDVHRRRWHAPLVRRFGIPADKLPRVVPPGSVVAGLARTAARRLGLRPDTPVVAAGGDQPASALGMGAAAVGDCSINTGTGSFLLACQDRVVLDPKRRFLASPHVLPGCWAMEAGLLATGLVVHWYAREFLGTSGTEALERVGRRTQPGAAGLVALPHLVGAAAPHWEPRARGAVWGLGLHHRPADVLRALVESICFELRANLDVFAASGVRPSQVRVSGGLARSAMFNQLQADVFNLPVVRVREPETAALGAAILGAAALGWYPDPLRAAGAMTRRHGRARRPRPDRVAQYESIRRRQQELNRRLSDDRQGDNE